MHYNSDVYESFGEAAAAKDGLAVLGAFVEVPPHSFIRDYAAFFSFVLSFYALRCRQFLSQVRQFLLIEPNIYF